MYFGTDSFASDKIELVWAIPDTPPKESSCIVAIYFQLLAISHSDKREIPFDISKFPISRVRGNDDTSDIDASVFISSSVMIEKSTIYPHILMRDSKPLMIPASMTCIFK